jgi:hypothetical protein
MLAAGMLAAIPLGAPAHADGNNWVELGYERHVVPLDSGFVVVVLCNASALTADQAAIPLATAVSCAVNGISANRANPGREAFVTVDATVVGPYTVCISGQAAFVNPVTNDISVPTAEPQCTTWPIE